MILDKKQIQAMFLFEFNMGHKALATAHNTNNAFGPVTANKCTVQWRFKKFCKGYKSLEDEEHSGWPSEVDKELENGRHWSWSSYKYTRSCWRAQCRPFHGHLAIEANWKGEKLDKWVPHELIKILKNHCFEESSSLILCNNEPFLNQIVMCNEKWILCDNQWWLTQW